MKPINIVIPLLFSIVSIILSGCNLPSLTQPGDECSPPHTALSQSSSLTLAEQGSMQIESRPDGESIIFSSPSGSIYEVSLSPIQSEQHLSQLTPRIIFDGFSLSQNDLNIAFASKDSSRDTSDIFVLDLNTNKETRLTNSTFYDARPIWRPNDKQITFSRNDGEQNRVRIYLMDVNTKAESLLLDFPAWDYSWSFNGEVMVFVSGRDGTDEVYTLKPNNEITRIVDMVGCDKAEDPIWSPIESRLAYVAWYGYSSEIFLVHENDNEGINLTNTTTDEYQPAWSPSGQQLAYVSFDGTNQEIYVLNVDDGTKFALTKTPEERESLPQWSSDGSFIAFISFTPETQENHLDVIEITSGERKRLLTFNELTNITE